MLHHILHIRGGKKHCQLTGSSAPTFALKVYFKALMHLLLIPTSPAFLLSMAAKPLPCAGAGRGVQRPTLGPKGHCGFKCAPCVARAAIALMQSDRDRCDISVPTHFHTTSHRLGVTHIPLLWSCPPAAGQHNDARMNLAIALTAARYGAAIANYTEVVHLLKGADPQTGKERVCGAHWRDVITGKSNKSHFLPLCFTLFSLSLALTTGALPALLTQC